MPDAISLHDAAADQASPPTPRTAALYSVASLGAGFFYGFNNATLPIILSGFTSNPLLIGLMSSTRSLEGVVVQPVVGAWSDRTWTRFGRRRPFVIVGIPASALFFVAAANATSLPLLVGSIFLFSLFFNAAFDPLAALLADLFPPERRSAANALATVVQLVGMVSMLLGGAQLAARHAIGLTLYLVAAVMVASAAVTVITLREPRHLGRDPDGGPREPAPDLRTYVAHLARHRMALRFLLCLFCYNFGVNAILPYLTLFALRVIHTSEETAQYLFLALVLATGLVVLPCGLLAARVGRKPVLAAGLGLMGAAALGGLVVQTVPQTLGVIVLAGLANAAISATTWPLLTELIPPTEVGVFTGIKTAFESVAVPASVALSSALIDGWGYRSIFAVLTLGAGLAIAILATVRPELAVKEGVRPAITEAEA